MAGDSGVRNQVQMEASQLWQAVLGDLKTRLSRSAFDNWLRQTSLVGFDQDVATVGTPNTFSASTLQARYASQVERVISDIVGRSITVTFTVFNSEETPDHKHDVDTADLLNGRPASAVHSRDRVGRDGPERASSGPAHPGRGTRAAGTVRGQPRRDAAGSVAPPRQAELSETPAHGLNPRYLYDNYVVGSANRFAHAASLAVAEQPGGKFNPFFVHGGVGLGKTHLLHAIGHRALELRSELSVAYVSSEQFTNELIAAIRKQRMDEFRARYRMIDILMIDDIQFIAGKESTQEEFFHTFNTLYQSGKQVIITSDRPPKAISALEDRLRSRFEGGLITDVQLPDFEMRTAILRAKGEELGARVPDDVVQYIAQKDQSNIRELEGALNKVIFRAQATEQLISVPLAMEALTDAAISARRSQVTSASVVDAVADHYGVSLRDLRGRARTKEIVGPRQVTMFLLREETDLSLGDIGKELGGRDHTTAMHGIEQIKRALTTDNELRSHVTAIREAIFTASAS